jgi:hypothetical protein
MLISFCEIMQKHTIAKHNAQRKQTSEHAKNTETYGIQYQLN